MAFIDLFSLNSASPGNAFAQDYPGKVEQINTIGDDLNDHETRLLAAESSLGSFLTTIALATANGAELEIVSNSELMTLDTGASFTDSAASLLPAPSIILGVVARVTTTITTAANWKLGDASTADRFTSANTTLAAGTTDYGFLQWTGTPEMIQTAAAALRITTNANPGAGAVRVTVWAITFTAPTS